MSKNIFNLKKGNIVRYNKKTLTIHCQKGALWITFPNSKDIILEQGNKINLKNNKLILLEALKDSTIEII